VNREDEPPLVTFAVKDGGQLSMCVGKLVWSGDRAFAEPIDYFGNPPELPKRIELIASQIEHDPNAALFPERYIHRGFVVIQR
jgi:hypothetical protein